MRNIFLNKKYLTGTKGATKSKHRKIVDFEILVTECILNQILVFKSFFFFFHANNLKIQNYYILIMSA